MISNNQWAQEKEAVFLLRAGQPRSETNRPITCPGDRRRTFDTSSDICMSHHATLPRCEVIDSTRPNCRVYQKPSLTTNKATVAKLKEYQEKLEPIKRQYEEKYGPLFAANNEANKWKWIKSPWPWENEEDD